MGSALEVIRSNLHEDLTTEEIARSVGVSYRAMHYAFREALGVSPYQYVQTERLHSIRRLLKTSDISIAQAGAGFGLYHTSRLALQYRRLFGELPSETRRAHRARANGHDGAVTRRRKGYRFSFDRYAVAFDAHRIGRMQK